MVKSSTPVYHHFCNGPLENEFHLRKVQTICSVLEKAIEHSRIIEYTSQTGPEKQAEMICPYALAYRPLEWHLIGYSLRTKDFEGFKLSPTCRISLTDQSFKRDESFSLQEFFASRWGTKGGEDTLVKVRFTGESALEIMDTNYHPREKVIKVGDKECMYSVTVKGTDEMLRWILGFGPEAEVLSPTSLREQIEKMAQGLARLYSKDAREILNQKTVMSRD